MQIAKKKICIKKHEKKNGTPYNPSFSKKKEQRKIEFEWIIMKCEDNEIIYTKICTA